MHGGTSLKVPLSSERHLNVVVVEETSSWNDLVGTHVVAIVGRGVVSLIQGSVCLRFSPRLGVSCWVAHRIRTHSSFKILALLVSSETLEPSIADTL